MLRKVQNDVEGKIIIRGILTYTLDEKRSMEYGKIHRIVNKERLLSPEELLKRIENPKDNIHRSGVCLLYAFHGKINNASMSFDTERNALIKTLGYTVATIKDGALYATFKLRGDLENDSTFVSRFDNDETEVLPDLTGAIKASRLELGSEIKFRTFKDKDLAMFTMPYMRQVYPEPGFFAKNGHVIMPENPTINVKRGAKRKRGRPANENKIAALNISPLRNMVTTWQENKSDKLGGFSIKNYEAKARSIVLEKEDEDGLSRIKLSLGQFRIATSYLSIDDDAKPCWILYREWVADKDSDSQSINREVKENLIKLISAF